MSLSKFYFVFFFTLLTTSLLKGAIQENWVVSGISPSTISHSDVCSDNYGNTYLIGSFSNNINIEGKTLATETLSSDGSNDIYIIKLDSTGNLVWSKTINGTGSNFGNAIATNKTSKILITGSFQNKVYVEGDSLESIGDRNLFLVELGLDGNLQWIKRDGTNIQKVAFLELDDLGNIYLTGYYGRDDTCALGHITLDQSIDDDMFIAKYDNEGDIEWANSWGGPELYSSGSTTLSGLDEVIGLTISPTNEVYISGNFSDVIFIGTDVLTTPHRVRDAPYIAKVNSSGNFEWSYQGLKFSSAPGALATGITADKFGNAYVLINDWFTDSLLLEGKDSTVIKTVGPSLGTSNDRDVIYIARYTPDGNVDRVTSFYFNKHVHVKTGEVSVSESGHILFTCLSENLTTSDSLIFQDSVIEFGLSGATTFFVIATDPNGKLSSFEVANTGRDWFNCEAGEIDIDANNNIAFTGTLGGFGAPQTFFKTDTFFNVDFFLAKYKASLEDIGFLEINIDSIASSSCLGDSISIYSSLSDTFNSDNTFSIILESASSSSSQTATLWSKNDSILPIVIRDIIPDTLLGKEYICKILSTSPQTASNVSLLSLLDKPKRVLEDLYDICEGDSILLDAQNSEAKFQWSNLDTSQGIYISAQDNYSVTITNSCGTIQDSTSVVLHELPIFDLGPDTFICNGDSIALGTKLDSLSHLWSNESSNSSIYVSEEGSYSVVVVDSFQCSQTDSIWIGNKDCNDQPSSYAEENNIKKVFSIYPNPAQEEIIIKYDYLNVHQLEIFDCFGRKILDIIPTTTIVDISSLQVGKYYLRSYNGNKYYRESFLKVN